MNESPVQDWVDQHPKLVYWGFFTIAILLILHGVRIIYTKRGRDEGRRIVTGIEAIWLGLDIVAIALLVAFLSLCFLHDAGQL